MAGSARLVFEVGPAAVGMRAGILTAWNGSTGANTVEVAGSSLADLPVLWTTALPSLTVGDTVHLLRVRSQYVILGKILQPPI